MKTKVAAIPLIMLVCTYASVVAATTMGPAIQYEECDGVTAAVAISDELFVVASRSDNILRIYAKTGSLTPLISFDLSAYLQVDRALPTTIQGATRVGDRIYWITSHGRDERGAIRPERYRFYATRVLNEGGQIKFQPVGRPVTTLVHKLVNRHTVRTLRLDKATRFGFELTEEERRELAPSRDGLNITALCGSHNAEILVAFRNPRPLRVTTGTAHALIVPLDNAAEMIEKGEDPIFGEGILLDLERRGIVSIEYSEFHKAYFFVAALPDREDSFVLYRWSGMKANRPEVIGLYNSTELDFFPETIVPFSDSDELLLLGHRVVQLQVEAQASDGTEKGSSSTGVFLGRLVYPG